MRHGGKRVSKRLKLLCDVDDRVYLLPPPLPCRRLTIRGRGRRARARRLRSLQAEVGHGATLVFFDLRRAPGDGPKQPKQPPPPPLTCSTA